MRQDLKLLYGRADNVLKCKIVLCNVLRSTADLCACLIAQ